MKLSLRLLPAAVVVALAAACAGLAPSSRTPENGRVAYIAPDGNVAVTAVGGNPENLTDDAESGRVVYSTVAWSPDGTEVVTVRNPQEGPASLVVVPVHGGSARTLHSDNRAPFYVYWSPAGTYIGFLSAAGGGSIRLQVTPSGGGETTSLGTGQPFYWDWSSDDELVVTHVGGSSRSNPDARIDLIRFRDGAPDSGRTLDHRPYLFQAPALSPDGRWALVALDSGTRGRTFVVEEGPALALVETTRGTARRILPVQGATSFAWAPSDPIVAWVEGTPTQLGLVGSLRLLDLSDPESPEPLPSHAADVLTFFWSPDGARIATFVPRVTPGPRLLMELHVMEVATGRSRLVHRFSPALQWVSALMPFYDQYQRSSTIWSPDGSRVLINALTPEGAPGIFVVTPGDSQGDETVDLVAEGTLPVWSP